MMFIELISVRWSTESCHWFQRCHSQLFIILGIHFTSWFFTAGNSFHGDDVGAEPIRHQLVGLQRSQYPITLFTVHILASVCARDHGCIIDVGLYSCSICAVTNVNDYIRPSLKSVLCMGTSRRLTFNFHSAAWIAAWYACKAVIRFADRTH